MSEAHPRYLCIHGHFYQPPRENPWLEAIEVQDSAAPFHDWNERVTRECYAPNSRARLVDPEGRIAQLSNNYAWMSFNFGPTVLAWMAQFAPQMLAGIVEGDRLSRERRGGHGNALAQVYNHIIMPLAKPHDQRTQVLWGIADFRLRFGREPEGMWLAETAVDLASLEALADAGIRFTILAPRQAKRWRPIGHNDWSEGSIDPSRAYRCKLPSGNTITLFFYDGAISQAVAFESLLDSGDRFLDRLRQGVDPSRQHPQLVHIATDGESYGHHHRYGDMALASVLDRLSKDPEIRLTNYGEFLEKHPADWEVEIHENSSWSCVHGVERWRSNCGCNMGRGWQQQWREPFRKALDRLKEQLDEVFLAEGKAYFPDPWAARDGYIEVILERNPESVRRFIERHAHPNLSTEQVRSALWLLEMQRHGLLMFTSCGWFFDELSGLETVQCLRYAARALQLARHFDRDFEAEFVAQLETAPSNVPEWGNGKKIWQQLVQPYRIDLNRVLAHYAISLVHGERPEQTSLYCYDIVTQDQLIASRGGSHLAIGRLKVRSQLTTSAAETAFIVIHYGGVDFHAVLRAAPEPTAYDTFKKKLFALYETSSLAEVTALVTAEFAGAVYHLNDLFVEEQRRIVGLMMQDRFGEYRQAFDRLADSDEDVMFVLGGLQYPVPRGVRTVISVSFDHRIAQAIETLDEECVKRVQQLLERGKAWGYQPDRDLLTAALARQMPRFSEEISASDDLTALTTRVNHLLDIAGMLQIDLDLWQAQNELIDIWPTLVAEKRTAPKVREAFAALADRFRIRRELLGWEP